MKVLWICNIILPVIAKQLKLEVNPIGGWLSGAAKSLVKAENVELTVCFGSKTNDKICGIVDGIHYISYFKSKDNVEEFKKVLKDVNPDIIHIWGTEAKHSLDMMEAAYAQNMENRTVVNIQGLISYFGRHHYYCHLPIDVISSNRLVELRYGHRIKDDREELLKEAESEIKTLELAKNVIGRTDWDEACTTQMNPMVNYYHCDATLRDSFYNHLWDISKCEKHSIFVSQSYWPIKGFHIAIEALAILKKQYSDAKLFVIGESPLPWYKSKHYAVRQRSYPRYLAKLICDNNLEDAVVFLPKLTEEQICERYLKSQVFVLPSSIENESNSVAEAMMLGMPVISSFVGGVYNFMNHGEHGYFYQSDAPYMLAYYICKVFGDEESSIEMGKRAREHILKAYDRENNLKTMLSIYDKIASESKTKDN